MKLDQFAVAVLMFSSIIVAGLLVVDDINTQYADQNVSIDKSDFANISDSSEELYNYSADMYGFISESDTGPDALLKAAYSALRLTVTPFKVAGQYINTVANVLQIPPQLITWFIGAMAVLFAFALVYLIFRFIPFT
tara:strand:+ start:11407 stop:11817 length:411 start_codon:yes stop_codon:yes gene_type:complete